MIRFFSEFHDPFVDYALGLISFFCKEKILRIDKNVDSGIYYGTARHENIGLVIPRVERYDLATIPYTIRKDYMHAASHQDSPFPFDIFSAMRFWLADEGNRNYVPKEGFDLHGRLIRKYSAQYKKGVLEKPIVNEYLMLLKMWLKIRLKNPLGSYLPSGKKCMVVLSHDVDKPINPGDPYEWYHAVKGYLGKGKIMLAARNTSSFLRRKLKDPSNKDRCWLFHEVMESEAKLGVRSTFFFAAKSINGPNSSLFDVNYNLSSPRFVKVIRAILERGFEVGLHLSYNANQKSDYIAKEKETLERIAGCQVIGNRHHFWKMKRPFWHTLEDHKTAGLLYDTSIAFNELPGYRLGIALPFYPWNPENSQRIDVVQIPTVLMDGAFFYEETLSSSEVVLKFKNILEGLKKNEGAACIDWHVHTSYPGSKEFRAWGEGYLALLHFLVEDSEVLICNGERALQVFLESWSP